MKGGITSGVVYPPAIVELARDHRFHNIGGSSAGAIAAVVAAAAEYGRQTGGPGFEALAKIPDELARIDEATEQTALHRLFVAQPETHEYFSLFWGQRSMKGASLSARIRSLLPALMRHSSPVPALPASLLIVILLAGAIAWLSLDPSPGTIGFAALAALVCAAVYIVSRAVAGASGLVAAAPAKLASNMHGLCNGASVGDQIGLTEWLHEKVEEAAGTIRGGEEVKNPPPLTYADLAAHDIGLVTLTTNLSQSSSENFPFDDEMWAFRQDDVETLFPQDVADHLIAQGKSATRDSGQRDRLEEQGLLKLPPAYDLPIILGARISLSFPLLLSAVRLWRLAPIRQEDGDWKTEYQEVWLSDGGICSNMPVHLFDSPLPARPTYGINLAKGTTGPVPTDDDDATNMRYAHENVWRPMATGSGAEPPISPVVSTIGLFGEVFNTMQNWSDSTMTRALSVRDRICTIRLDDGEGGMNLDMSSATIRGLAPRGRATGENLGWMVRGDRPEQAAGDNDEPDELAAQWTRHRWTRLRANALGLGTYIRDISRDRTASSVSQAGSRCGHDYTYNELATQAHNLPYLPYRSSWNDKAGASLIAALDALGKVDFGTANTKSSPPLRKLALTTQTTPKTALDE